MPAKIDRMLWTAAAVVAATRGESATRGEPAVSREPATRGEPTRGEPATRDAALRRAAGVFTSVSIDSRHIRPGALFVPLRAERDGHDFLLAALRSGAAGYLYEPGRLPGDLGRVTDATAIGIEVADTRAALLDLGRAARDRLDVPVVGITGSVGKTSTKDLMAAALGAERRVAASERSFNNEIGVPLTLANAPGDTEIAVIEMGARHGGHIALLCTIARPTIAVVTAVALAHTAIFGSLEAVAAAKGELVESIAPGGLAVLNADDHRVAALAARTEAAVVAYSADGLATADVVATDVRIADDLRPSFLLSSPWGSGPVTLAARGAHQVGNALAAATVALHQGLAWEAVVTALANAAISPWRMELRTAASGARVLNDAYNANPGSMAAALRSLALLPARRRIAVVGAMAELGDEAPAHHRAVTALADELGVDLIVVGTADYGRPAVAGIDEALVVIGPLGADDAVLVKASRVAGLERLAARLMT